MTMCNTLMVAARHGDQTLVHVLLDADADPNATVSLFIGASHNNEESKCPISAMIKVGIHGLRTPNGKVGIRRNVAIVHTLLDRSVDINEGGDASCEAISYYTYLGELSSLEKSAIRRLHQTTGAAVVGQRRRLSWATEFATQYGGLRLTHEHSGVCT
jgi:hypothetical protein